MDATLNLTLSTETEIDAVRVIRGVLLAAPFAFVASFALALLIA